MSQTTLIKRHQTIKVKVTARPILTNVPKFVPQGLISGDKGNTLALGQDNKLFINLLTKQDW